MSLKKLCELCKAGVYIDVNGHKDIYISVDDYLADEADVPLGMKELVMAELDISADVYNKMIELDTVIRAQFYPHTPIGCYVVYGFDVDNVIERCVAILEELQCH